MRALSQQSRRALILRYGESPVWRAGLRRRTAKLGLSPDRMLPPMRIVAPVIVPLLLLATASTFASPAREAPSYPVAPRDRIATDYFGTRVPAPYRWMENMQ